MASKSGLPRSIFDEIHCLDIQGDQMEGESGVTRSTIDDPHSCDMQEIERKMKVVLLEISLVNFILRISKDMKWKVKVELLEVSI